MNVNEMAWLLLDLIKLLICSVFTTHSRNAFNTILLWHQHKQDWFRPASRLLIGLCWLLLIILLFKETMPRTSQADWTILFGLAFLLYIDTFHLINTMLCPIIFNCNTIELTLHTFCYLGLGLTLC